MAAAVTGAPAGAVTAAVAGAVAVGDSSSPHPVIVAELQPDSALTKKPGLAYVGPYESKFGKDSRTQFGAHMWDVLMVLERVIPAALKKAKPGTEAFRDAIREALVAEKDIAASQGVYNFTDKDRYGVDDRARILIAVKDGNWALVP